MNTKYLEQANEKIITKLLADPTQREEKLNMIIDFINKGNFDFSIHPFDTEKIHIFTNRVNSVNELVEFGNFYKSVNGDLSDAYFITEALSPVTFVESTDKLIEDLKIIVSSSLSRDETKDLNVFLVKTFF